MKQCARCREFKALGDFVKDSRKKDGAGSYCQPCIREYRKQYYAKNAERQRARAREWAANNPERTRQRLVEWRKNNPERDRANRRAWHEANPPDRARKAEIARDWYRRHGDYARELKRLAALRRNARRKSAAEYELSAKDARRLLASGCRVEGCTSTDIQLDHVIPISRGGSHGIGNLQPLCAFHNRSKSGRLWIEFRVYLRTRSAA